MPGIVGLIGKSFSAEHKALLDRMLGSMMHEPFYVSGSHVDEETGIGAGWVAHQGSASEHMPIWNERRDICLIFSGEHFGDSHEIDNLNGHAASSGSAAWLIRLYEEKGSESFESLNGWFSGLIIDLRQKRAVLFNDRYGINRIYIHENSKGFYFASEAKALLRILPETRSIDYQGLGEYFSCGCVLEDRTLFSGIRLLPVASAWSLNGSGAVKKESYFQSARWEKLPELSREDYYEQLKATWLKIVPRYLTGDAGLSLTGGVDSRMIAACAPGPRGNLPSYTFGGMYRDCADVQVSREVARLCEQPHETIPLDKGLFAEFPALSEKAVYITDGVLDVTGATDLYVHRRVREIAPIRVTGLYGGEILRSLVVFKPMRQSQEHLSEEFVTNFNEAQSTYLKQRTGHQQSFIVFKQAPWHIYPRLSIERSQVTIRTPYFDNELVALSYQAPAEALSYEPALRLIAEAKPCLRGLGTDRAIGVRTLPGLGRGRHWMQQFTYKAEYAYDYGMPQWLARIDGMVAPLHLERLFLGRHKYYHFRLWYRDHLNKYLQQVLLDERSLQRPHIRGKLVERMIRAHVGGQGNYTLEIHRLLTAELIQRTLIEIAAEGKATNGTRLHGHDSKPSFVAT